MGEIEIKALSGVDFSIDKGEFVIVAGASGAGKSTILNILGGMDKPSKGKVVVDSQEVSSFSNRDLITYRRHDIGFVFQFHQLLPEFNALENVCIPGFIANRSKNQVEQEARDLLEFLGLSDRTDHKPNELSGGEQQRVAVARALINSPDVIFADEPSGNLDTASSRNLHELFFALREKFGQTFVIVTHNQELANMADRKLEMKDGKII